MIWHKLERYGTSCKLAPAKGDVAQVANLRQQGKKLFDEAQVANLRQQREDDDMAQIRVKIGHKLQTCANKSGNRGKKKNNLNIMEQNNSGRNVIVYIAMSLDGFIAKENGDIEFLSMVEKEGEDYGYHDFIKTVDTVIVGRKTYDKIISLVHNFPHQDKESYIITRTKRPDQGNIIFYNEDLQSLIEKLKSKEGKNIYCDGGAEIIHELLQINQVDEFYISIIPVLLGSGIHLFKDSGPGLKLKLKRSITFESGLVQLHYTRTSI